FAYPLADKNVQPIWIEIDNRGNDELNLMLLSIDPAYFSPSEVAWNFRRFKDGEDTRSRTYEQKADYFLDRQIPVRIPPKSTVSGFVYTHLDPGRKAFTVELLGQNKTLSFDYFQGVPGFRPDFAGADLQAINASAERRDLNLEQFRSYLEELPCCASGGDRKTPGDPLNLVFVGSGKTVLAAMSRQGWDLTETTRPSTVGRMVASSLFNSFYRTSPVSPLYLFDRRQDAALQEVRTDVDERNHMRLWRAPVNVNGQAVWVGQVSRDIGVKLSSVTGITHKIDPLVDEARLFVTLETIAAQSLQAIGYVNGVGVAGRESGRTNYTKDPYYTDGNRVVIFLSDDRVSPENITYLDWEVPLSSKQGGERSIER
ncbi:MAG: LssY C-terminal domain-containing protein, partial [Roseobacter sp.]|nr:LssY C-terminal domain-containing protein [Roseobacter sp.]